MVLALFTLSIIVFICLLKFLQKENSLYCSGFFRFYLVTDILETCYFWMHGVEIELAWSDYTPAAEVSEEATTIAREANLATVGKKDTHLTSLHRAVMISISTRFIIRT